MFQTAFSNVPSRHNPKSFQGRPEMRSYVWILAGLLLGVANTRCYSVVTCSCFSWIHLFIVSTEHRFLPDPLTSHTTLIWCPHVSCQICLFLDDHTRHRLFQSRPQGVSFSAVLKLWFSWVLWGPLISLCHHYQKQWYQITSDWTPGASNQGSEDVVRAGMPLVLAGAWTLNSPTCVLRSFFSHLWVPSVLSSV